MLDPTGQDRRVLVATKAYGPNTDRLWGWLDALQPLTRDSWRRIQARAHTTEGAFAIAAKLVETSPPLQVGMLRVAADTGLTVATAALSDSGAARMLEATRNAGLAVFTLDLVSGEAFGGLYRPFQEALATGPIKQQTHGVVT